jgi:ribosomal protein L12E/L44/L45/RPP1/RPP2
MRGRSTVILKCLKYALLQAQLQSNSTQEASHRITNPRLAWDASSHTLSQQRRKRKRRKKEGEEEEEEKEEKEEEEEEGIALGTECETENKIKLL